MSGVKAPVYGFRPGAPDTVHRETYDKRAFRVAARSHGRLARRLGRVLCAPLHFQRLVLGLVRGPNGLLVGGAAAARDLKAAVSFVLGRAVQAANSAAHFR